MRQQALSNRQKLIVFVLVAVLASAWNAAFAQIVKSVDAVGMTVSDMDRSVDFLSKVLSLEKVSDMDKAYHHLRQHKIRHASTGPQTIPATNKAAAGIRAFYFKDVDGHNLEIIYFPPSKGDPRRQQKTDKLFLGIDHTAIVVSNTQNSLKFYRDILGLKLAGESMNYGPEQERLTTSQARGCTLAA